MPGIDFTYFGVNRLVATTVCLYGAGCVPDSLHVGTVALRYRGAAALLAVAAAGLVPGESVFAGFGHPAVITVAAVLVVSRGLFNSGLVDVIAGWLSHTGDNPGRFIGTLTGFTALSSGFMNNVGALALLMPVAIRASRKRGFSPSTVLMPLAFGSLLGGLITLIGTPPNIIIAAFRAETAAAEPFRMFDFAPVGGGVALAGVLFIALAGWRLIPRRTGEASQELFRIDDYVTELVVPDGSPMLGRRLRDLEQTTDGHIVMVNLIRGKQRWPAPSPTRGDDSG